MPFQSGEENKKAPVMVKAEATAAELVSSKAGAFSAPSCFLLLETGYLLQILHPVRALCHKSMTSTARSFKIFLSSQSGQSHVKR